MGHSGYLPETVPFIAETVGRAFVQRFPWPISPILPKTAWET